MSGTDVALPCVYAVNWLSIVNKPAVTWGHFHHLFVQRNQFLHGVWGAYNSFACGLFIIDWQTCYIKTLLPRLLTLSGDGGWIFQTDPSFLTVSEDRRITTISSPHHTSTSLLGQRLISSLISLDRKPLDESIHLYMAADVHAPGDNEAAFTPVDPRDDCLTRKFREICNPQNSTTIERQVPFKKSENKYWVTHQWFQS